MVDYEKLGELIDGYGGISADDLGALPEVDDSDGASLVGSLGRENAKLRAQLCDLRLERGNYINDEMARLRADNKRLREAEDDFHMQYRLRCDEQTKQLVVERDRLQEDNRRLRAVLAQFELVLIDLRGGIVGDDSDVLGGSQA